MKLKLKALPVFDKEKALIFLKEMEVVDATGTTGKMQTVMQTLLPYLNRALRNYFNQQPAYVPARRWQPVAKQWRKTGERH